MRQVSFNVGGRDLCVCGWWLIHFSWLKIEQEPDEWQTVFVIASVIHFLGVAFYAVFASGELQPWAEPKDDEADVPALTAAPTTAWNPFDSQQKPQYNGEQQPNYASTV